MFKRIRPEFQCLEEYDQNSNVSKDKIRNPVFGRIGPEFPCLVDKVTFPMLKMIGREFQCLEG